MAVAGSTALRWAVSIRTHGEVLTAGTATPELELDLIGVPQGFTPVEIEGWLRDLAGVSLETSRNDTHSRAIPALLHHALTGLLFSQAELWSQLDGPGPCSAAFVDTPEGGAFGWVGEARVNVLVDGEPVEPVWVRVRDDLGREACAAKFEPDQDVVVTIEYWPHGEDGSAATAAIEAEWAPPNAAGAAHAAGMLETSTGPVVPQAPAEAAAAPTTVHAGPLPAELQTQQPGLAHAQNLEPAEGEPIEEVPRWRSGTGEAGSGDADAGRAQHPVGRWLGRLMNWGRPAPVVREPRREPRRAPADATPLSTYDSLLSESHAPPSPPSSPPVLHPSPQTPPSPHEAPPSLAPPVLPTSSAEPLQDWQELESAPEEAEPLGESVVTPAVVPVAPAPPSPVVIRGLRPAGLDDVFRRSPPKLRIAPENVVDDPEVGDPDVVLHMQSPVAIPDPAARRPLRDDVPETRADVVKKMNEAAAESLPVISPSGPRAPGAPLRIDREPEPADRAFAMPKLPRPPSPAGSVPAAPRRPAVVPASAELAGPASPALHVSGAGNEPPTPPVLRVNIEGEKPGAPPVLRVPRASAPRAAIIPTPPVQPVVPVEAFAPTPAAAAAPEPSQEEPAGPPVMSPAVTPRPQGARPIARPAWPALELQDKKPPLYRRPWFWVAVVALVFVLGWLLGGIGNSRKDQPSPMTRLVRALGLGGARFEAVVTSTPPGAWIAIDGKDAARRTPATIDVLPGEHTLTLTLPDLGSAKFPLRGQRGDHVTLDAPLNGGLEIYAADSGVPIAVALDGRAQGYAPLKFESLAPGLHEIQFSGPGMPAWAQTVQIGVHATVQLVARPMSAPANGVIQVQAMLNDDQGASALAGAQVFVDGELRGATPASVELPRGPHSLRLTWHGETAPVQVIDLPGGNQRFASFNFGLDTQSPQVTLLAPQRVMIAGQTTVVSASLVGLQANDVRESWLHVRSPEGLWRRYPMTTLHGPVSAVVVSVFPSAAFDSQGQTRWYVSVSTPQGDEYFSEMQSASLASRAAAKPAVVPEKPAPEKATPEN